jgi:hypothetical protein
MTDFETFLAAIDRLPPSERHAVLGDEHIIYPPDEQLGYESTPRDAVAFGSMGVDGVHYLILKLDGEIRNDSPVVQFSPMDFSAPYTLLGHTFADYLATVCGVDVDQIRHMMERERADESVLATFLRVNFDHRRLDMDGLGAEIRDYADLLPPIDT